MMQIEEFTDTIFAYSTLIILLVWIFVSVYQLEFGYCIVRYQEVGLEKINGKLNFRI